jgi:hypothetical protein
MRRVMLAMLLVASAAAFVGTQTDKLDYAMLGRIRDEGLSRSQVMEHSDNGTGKIRGIWLQSNMVVRPIFEQWMAPLKTSVSRRSARAR